MTEEARKGIIMGNLPEEAVEKFGDIIYELADGKVLFREDAQKGLELVEQIGELENGLCDVCQIDDKPAVVNIFGMLICRDHLREMIFDARGSSAHNCGCGCHCDCEDDFKEST